MLTRFEKISLASNYLLHFRLLKSGSVSILSNNNIQKIKLFKNTNIDIECSALYVNFVNFPYLFETSHIGARKNCTA